MASKLPSLATALVLLPFAWPAWAQTVPSTPPATPATLSLEGSASIAVPPDAALVTIGVVSEGKTARDALAENTKALQTVVDELKAAGLPDKDLQTSNLSIQPVYATRKRNDGRDVPEIVGYSVNNTLTARVAPVGKVGPLLDVMVRQGANRLNGIDFVVDNTNRRLDEARAAAMADAKRKAEIYASGAGVKLGRVLSISEGAFYQPPSPKLMRGAAMMAEAAPAPVPIQGGEETLSARVSVVWEILPATP
jgi:hypothetical protein